MNEQEVEQSRINADRVEAIAQTTAEFAKSQGASSVIVFVGVPDGELHNAWSGYRIGRTLELRGLLEFGYPWMLSLLKFPVLPTSVVKNNEKPTKNKNWIMKQLKRSEK